MYALAAGPLLWISLALFVGGLIYRAVRLFRMTERHPERSCTVTLPKDARPPSVPDGERALDRLAALRNSMFGKHPVMVIMSALFHVSLFAAPLFLAAHNALLRRAIGFGLPSLPDGVCDAMTVIVLAGAAFFLVRRLAVPRVAAVSGVPDYAVLALTALPFLTGFLAYHQVMDSRAVMTVHVLSGDLLLAVLPFTKISHMVFFFFARLTLAGENCLGRGTRDWAPETR
jgi:nitrate reductase gamma subunit